MSPADRFTPYGPKRFPENAPVAHRGYLFTTADGVECAAYRARGRWEVREAAAPWPLRGEGPTRRTSVQAADRR